MEVFEFFPEGDPTHPEAFGGFGFVPLSLLKGFHDAGFFLLRERRLCVGHDLLGLLRPLNLRREVPQCETIAIDRDKRMFNCIF